MAVLLEVVRDPNPLTHLWAWIEIHTGTWDPGHSPAYYNFWSGFGSDLGEITLITAVVMTARHTNCHVRHCWRVGKPVEGTAFRACHHHHPAHEGDSRNVTVETIHEAHKAAQ